MNFPSQILFFKITLLTFTEAFIRILSKSCYDITTLFLSSLPHNFCNLCQILFLTFSYQYSLHWVSLSPAVSSCCHYHISFLFSFFFHGAALNFSALILICFPSPLAQCYFRFFDAHTRILIKIPSINPFWG